MPSPKERIEALRAEIEGHNRLYYDQAKPKISDRAYDKLVKELETLEGEWLELQEQWETLAA